jgi:hypothetical protein
MSGTKKNVILVELPKDLEVKKGSEVLEIKDRRAASANNGNGHSTLYMYPGVRVKLTNDLSLKLISGGQTASVPVMYNYMIGGLIFETFYTLGVGTIIDLVTGAAKKPKLRYIDVPAAFNKTKPRSQKELKRVVMGMN